MSLAWAAKKLLILRRDYGPAKENEWAFGQIVSLVLLAAPLVALADHWPQRPNQLASQETTVNQADDAPLTSHSSRQWTEKDYEFSLSFRIGALIAGVPYVHLAIMVLVKDGSALSDLLTYFTFTAFAFYPVLQATWTLYALWIPKLNLQKRHKIIALDIIYLTIMILMVRQTSELFSRKQSIDNRFRSDFVESLIYGGVCIGMLVVTYLIFVVWVVLDAQVQRMNDDNNGLLRRILPRFLAIATSVTLPVIFFFFVSMVINPSNPYLAERYQSPSSREIHFPWVPAAAVLAGTILVQLLEVKLQTIACTKQRSVRKGICFLSLVGSMIIPWTLPSAISPVFEILLVLLVTCPIWTIFWICWEVV